MAREIVPAESAILGVSGSSTWHRRQMRGATGRAVVLVIFLVAASLSPESALCEEVFVCACCNSARGESYNMLFSPHLTSPPVFLFLSLLTWQPTSLFLCISQSLCCRRSPRGRDSRSHTNGIELRMASQRQTSSWTMTMKQAGQMPETKTLCMRHRQRSTCSTAAIAPILCSMPLI